MAKKDTPPGPGRYAYEGLDRVMHEKARLGILTSLLTRAEGLLFGEIKQLCSLTDGNLSRHLDALEASGLIEILKGVEKKRPQTRCRLTPSGRKRFQEYLAELEQVIHDALPHQGKAHNQAKPQDNDFRTRWAPA
jgi:DNA-binding MarR family transcriptional regulator